MEFQDVIPFLETNHRGVISTTRPDSAMATLIGTAGGLSRQPPEHVRSRPPVDGSAEGGRRRDLHRLQRRVGRGEAAMALAPGWRQAACSGDS